MKKVFSLLCVALSLSASVHADESLAKSKNCLACHGVEKKIVGPAYKDVADKYAKNPSAADMLAKKIRSGGSGVWGAIPMPPNTNVNEAEALSLSKWILSTGKTPSAQPATTVKK